MNLKPLISGEPQYLWVLDKNTERWLVSDWDGNECWLVAEAFEAKPDLQYDEDGRLMPVLRRIGSGHLAQHYRFERRASA